MSEHDYEFTQSPVEATMRRPAVGMVEYGRSAQASPAYAPAPPRDSSAGYGSHPGSEDRRGRVTSVFSLLLSLVVLGLSVAGAAAAPVVASRPDAGIVEIVPAVFVGLGLIVAAFVVETPTVLLALRAVGKAPGQVGRGRGMFSIVVGTLAPTVALVVLVLFTVGQVNALAQAIETGSWMPQVVEDENGRVHVTAPEFLGEDMAGAVERFNELSEQGYSIGTDADGNLVATNPDGESVVIDEEKLAELRSML